MSTTYTLHYACGHTATFQGRECSCVYKQLTRINDPRSFSMYERQYLPFNNDTCRHQQSHKTSRRCADCRYYGEYIEAEQRRRPERRPEAAGSYWSRWKMPAESQMSRWTLKRRDGYFT